MYVWRTFSGKLADEKVNVLQGNEEAKVGCRLGSSLDIQAVNFCIFDVSRLQAGLPRCL